MKRLWAKYPPELLLLIVGSAATRLIGLGYPRSTVFDEVYFKAFAGAYFSHKYYFDIHPPLGKLLLAGWAWLWRVNPATITVAPATSLRWLVALTGVTVAPLVYGIVRRLTRSRLAAGLAGLIIMLDGALIVESRFVLVDSLLIAFGLGAIYTATRWQERQQPLWLALMGLLAGCAISIKWTGLTALVVVLIIFVKGCSEQLQPLTRRIAETAILVALVAIVYIGSFWIHFALLPQSGPGDAFMSTQFQQTLKGSPVYNPKARLSFWDKFTQLNTEMYHANATLTATHPYGSKWYTWPIEGRPIYYWEGPVLANGQQGNIYLLGDPVIWWAATASTAVALAILVWPRWRKRFASQVPVLALLTFAYLINWLPFAGITRVMFLYHYFYAFIFSVMILAILIGTVLPVRRVWYRSPRHLGVGLVILVAVSGFIFFSPLTYGWPISIQAFNLHLWLPSWR